MLITILQIGTRLLCSSSLGSVTLISMGDFQDGCRSIDLYHAVTILVMFHVSITVMNAKFQCANMAPDYYFVQSQFGYNELEWSKIKMATPWWRSIPQTYKYVFLTGVIFSILQIYRCISLLLYGKTCGRLLPQTRRVLFLRGPDGQRIPTWLYMGDWDHCLCG